jgi:hypothetical protein
VKPTLPEEVGERIRALLRERDYESAAAYSAMKLEEHGIDMTPDDRQRVARPEFEPPYPPITGSATTVSHEMAAIFEAPEQPVTWADLGRAWDEFRSASLAREWRNPPSEKQRAMLWPVVDARPDDAARWLREAPGTTYREALDFVLRQWAEFRSNVPTTRLPRRSPGVEGR